MKNVQKKVDLSKINSIKDLEDGSLSFEEAYEILENIISSTESGTLTLEDSINYYKRGKILVEYCQTLLNNAKTTIEKINNN